MNQFAGRGGRQRATLLKAGTALRDAQEALVAGEGDREALTRARDRERSAVAAALGDIQALAADAGTALSDAATERVRHTLHAIALDEDVRRQFEQARLTGDHEASGLGGGALPAGGAMPAPTGKPKRDREGERKRRRRAEVREAEADRARRKRELETAELELAEATKAAERAQGDLKRATKQRDRARAATQKSAERVAALRAD